MLDWKEASPLIGVIITVFGGIVGALWARNTRSGQPDSAIVTSALGVAVRSAGHDDGIMAALTQVAVEISKAVASLERRAEADEDLRIKHHREMIEAIYKLGDRFAGR